ncbi:hypothetical protein ACRE_076560 [Hapsidospora chrysogenum ATCC 11550]|uniref:Uncharacterized protein n=1 Tax=Hapsidospora chrysogenum (strain ATCC 11550 / CBS 779.69 / DSM 880 / IAM 14645 / JCM 23072 / IMI 49137) TaxID=857340 RepID=A0A086SWX3_HAPC1|nr:hypothetical protein ACRE_076560 [Hapsidospora chrysogenum ATCC 11550]
MSATLWSPGGPRVGEAGRTGGKGSPTGDGLSRGGPRGGRRIGVLETMIELGPPQATIKTIHAVYRS